VKNWIFTLKIYVFRTLRQDTKRAGLPSLSSIPIDLINPSVQDTGHLLMVVEWEGVVNHWNGLIHNCPVGVKDCSTDLVMEYGVYSTILHPLHLINAPLLMASTTLEIRKLNIIPLMAQME